MIITQIGLYNTQRERERERERESFPMRRRKFYKVIKNLNMAALPLLGKHITFLCSNFAKWTSLKDITTLFVGCIVMSFLILYTPAASRHLITNSRENKKERCISHS